jgi:predicted DNA-binding transcriptional regulator YafY
MEDDRYETAGRLLELVDEARAGKRLTVARIERRFGVRTAAARRYLRFVEAHVPLEVETLGGRKTSKRPAATERAFVHTVALELGVGMLGWMRATPFYRHVRDIVRQIRGGVAPEEQDRLDRFIRAFAHRARGDVRYDHRRDAIDGLLRAIRERRICRMRYERADRLTSDYLVEPWLLVLYQDRLYLVARKLPDGERRTFDLDGVQSLAPTGDEFVPPSRDECDPDVIFGGSFGIYTGVGEPVLVHVRARGAAAGVFRRRKLHASQETAEGRDGTVDVRLRVAVCPELRSFLLGLLPEIEIVAPGALADDMRAAARAFLEPPR